MALILVTLLLLGLAPYPVNVFAWLVFVVIIVARWWVKEKRLREEEWWQEQAKNDATERATNNDLRS
jgi:hypothetical protein